ncbi:MAG: recombination protein RecR [Zetaproteobacteria bacterium]|nr:MAG: recombination protein RecR [Zetaproteobacteria bacterium]
MGTPGVPAPLAAAIEALASLPGIGPKTAMRLVLHLLQRPASEAGNLADILHGLHARIGFCDRCGGFADQGRCPICTQPGRDPGVVCVVEQPVDVLMMERGGVFRGVYHVLHGRLSPVDGVGPEQLRIRALDARLAQGVKELILATSATVDGEATAHYLAQRYRTRADTISRIARGVPEGGELEYLDEYTLQRALDQRVPWQ